MQIVTKTKGWVLGSILLGINMCVPAVWAAETIPANAVQMVTYFPVPYAKYEQLNVTEKLDIGTAVTGFTLDVGKFWVNTLNLYKGALQVGLNLQTETASFGNKDADGEGATAVQFKDVYLNQWKTGESTVPVELKGITTSISLKVKDKALPACAGKVYWRKSGDKCYLVCCTNTTGLCGNQCN